MSRFVLLALCWLVIPAMAHEVRPAYLEIVETGPDTFDVLFKVPAAGGDLRFGLYLRLPDDVQRMGAPRSEFTGRSHVERSRIRRPGGLVGSEIYVEGLSATLTDALVRVQRADGTAQVLRLTPDRPSFVVEAAPTPLAVAGTYTKLGIEHILLGVDHLLFVFALLLLVEGTRRLVITITAFTIAHSITLAGATLGVVQVPGPPIEACIALSIMFVAAEIIHGRRGQPGLTARWPWLVAFVFGLLHGFGFAGALREVGLPDNSIPAALLFFNVGVEVGQLLFIAAALAAMALVRRGFRYAQERRGNADFLRHAAINLPVAAEKGSAPMAYAIGGMAAFWVIQRVASF
jgi:hydrogenase/urease accessory protein HupE